ncbi:peroxidase-like [Bombyx mandarina]|uniref:Peroxidase-like n=1 Tax=Bombyx mandarina TaxID=7092 RepID=A0A6J2JFP3_BOMMA|nr:peroxidase-like [Bombyx mandarina]
MSFLPISILIILVVNLAKAVYYDSWEGTPLTDEQRQAYENANILSTCANNIQPCDETEWRRTDGSCNNLYYPTRGAYHTPTFRILPADFREDFEPRLTSSGKEYPLARHIKNNLLTVGLATDAKLTQLSAYYIEFMAIDVVSAHDILNYIVDRPYCCKEEGKSDPMCAPNFIPEFDPVHRFSGHKCFNMTIPMTFQNLGCIENGTTPSRIDFTTTFFDLSNIYEFSAGSLNQVRSYEGGQLKYEVVNGRQFPSDASDNTTCFIKQAISTGCSRNVPNGVLGSNLFTTWFWRFHNYVAQQLANLNPSWDDERLFYTARDIVVAFHLQMFYYEFLPEILGKDHMIEDEIILGNSTGFRDIYDETVEPQIALEYAYASRWFHTIQYGAQKLFDKNFNFIKEVPMVNFSLSVQSLAIGDIMSTVTRGSYYQATGKADSAVDPDISDIGLGPVQEVFDIPTTDLAKGRYFGLPSYTKYRDFCSGYSKKHVDFDDLTDHISDEKIQQLKQVYETAEDIELMAGIWVENVTEGAQVPPTVHCLLSNQLKRSIIIDRHWYERPNRPHAFNYEQLQEIRKASLALLLCYVGDDVEKIQPKAFTIVGKGNNLVSCDEIPAIDFTHWKEEL